MQVDEMFLSKLEIIDHSYVASAERKQRYANLFSYCQVMESKTEYGSRNYSVKKIA